MAEYIVKAGDTLSGIAKNLNVSQSSITGYRSGNANLIFPGEKLSYGGAGASPVATSTPVTPAQVPLFADQVQQDAFVRENTLDLEQIGTGLDMSGAGEQVNALTQQLMGNATRPTSVSLLDTFNEFRTTMGLGEVEGEIAKLKADEQAIYAAARQRTNFERGKTVAMNVQQGRVSEVERQERENLDFVQRQISFRTDQLNSAYSVINQMVQFTQMDYQNASDAYDKEFSQKMSMYEQLRSEQFQERDFQFKFQQAQKDNARANLEIFTNMITKGNMNYNDLDRSTQLEISKLEIQSGLGLGFTGKLKIAPSESVKAISERVDPSGNKYADVLKIDQNGKMYTESVFLGKQSVAKSSGGGSSSSSSSNAQATAAAKKKADFNNAADNFRKELRSGDSWGAVWNSFRSAYPDATNGDIDAALGVPASWILSRKPGWEWFNQQGGNY